MALIDRNKVEKLKKTGDIQPKHETGLYLPQEDSERLGGPKGADQAIVLQPQRGKPQKQSRHIKAWWPEKTKIEVATLYAATGSAKRASELSKVPLHTVEAWTKEDWFLLILSRVKREENLQTDRKITKIVDEALDKIMDRVQHGDYVYDIKRGVAAQVPMSGRDLAIVTGTIFDKRQLLRGEATKITEAVNSEEQLEKLALRFRQFVADKSRATKQLEATDVELIEESPNEA